MHYAPSTTTTLNNSEYLYFSGTSYYSLHSNKQVINSSIKALEEYGIGSAVSRLTYGCTPLLSELENKISNFFNTDDSVFLPSGYMTSLASFKALIILKNIEVIYIDEGAHYSVYDGARATGLPMIKFKHQDADDLESKLKTTVLKSVIATDGVFPLFGDIAPLNKYEELLDKYNALLWVDDAHGVGVLGKNGRGAIEHHNINNERVFFGATLSKAFGSYGGFIAGTEEFIAEIKNGEVVKGANSMPTAVMGASIKGLDILKENPEMRNNLWDNAQYLKQKLSEIGILTNNTVFPIVAWQMEQEDAMIHVKDALMKRGIAIQQLKYSGSKGGALRIVTFSNHTKEQIDTLAKELKEALAGV